VPLTFRQVSLEVHTYRDALEFRNGAKVRLQELEDGQQVEVFALSSEKADNHSLVIIRRTGICLKAAACAKTTRDLALGKSLVKRAVIAETRSTVSPFRNQWSVGFVFDPSCPHRKHLHAGLGGTWIPRRKRIY
jgi:hypothetical protein